MDADAFADLFADAGAAVSSPAALRTLVLSAVLIGAAALVGRIAGRRIERALERRVRRIHGRPRLLRLLAVLLRRLPAASTALLLWIVVLVAREMPHVGDLPLVATAAALVTAWTVIRAAARVVRNRFAARTVAVVGWSLVALEVVGLLDPITAELDDRAVALGGLRLSVLAALKAIVWFAVLVWFAGLVGGGVETRLKRSTELTPSLQVLIGKLVRVGLFTVAVIVSLSAVGLDLSTLTVLSGAVGLGLGFGLQTVVSNLVSGIIILADKSIKPGDIVEIDGRVGWIRELKARFVSIVTRDGREILVPNEDFITERVVNWSFTDTKARLDVTFGAAFDCDPHLVRRLARTAAAGVTRVLADPPPVCHITGYGEFRMEYILRFWIDDAENGLTNVRGDVLLALWDAFQEAGIRVPYPVQEVRMAGVSGTPRDV